MLQLICILLLNIAYTQWMLKAKDRFALTLYFSIQGLLIYEILIMPLQTVSQL